jgi:hypothetical protein
LRVNPFFKTGVQFIQISPALNKEREFVETIIGLPVIKTVVERAHSILEYKKDHTQIFMLRFVCKLFFLFPKFKQLTIQSSYLIKLPSFVREILNPALARASTLSDNSTVLNDLVLQFK